MRRPQWLLDIHRLAVVDNVKRVRYVWDWDQDGGGCAVSLLQLFRIFSTSDWAELEA